MRTAPRIFADTLVQEADPAALMAHCLATDERLEGKHLQAATMMGESCDGIAVTNCVLRGWRLTGTRFLRAGFTDVRFENCELSGCNFGDSRFTRVEFINCKMLGAIFGGSHMQDVLLQGCKAPTSSFMECTLRIFQTKECDFSGADFTDCKPKWLRFEETNFSNARFYHTSLAGVNLAGCNISGLGAEVHSPELRGAKMDVMQLGELAALLGITLV